MFDVDGLVSMVDTRLRAADEALARDYPGERVGWQPVHTVYVPADRFTAQTCREYGDVALGLLDQHADLFRDVTGADDRIVDLVRTKLRDQPIENVRVDFEDGYGARSDDEEDTHARAAAEAFWSLMSKKEAPPRYGIRFKSLEPTTRRRGLRTLVRLLFGSARGTD